LLHEPDDSVLQCLIQQLLLATALLVRAGIEQKRCEDRSDFQAIRKHVDVDF
jgi:hypothetical protein